jgi:integrase
MSAGCRLSEAIGITWNNIDFQNSEIIISQSLSRDPRFNDYQRTMSTRKADGVVYIDMKNDLKEILLKRYEVKLPKEDYKDGYDLVFRSPRGKIISNSNLIQYCWKPLLESLDIPYRNLQNHRHTFASEAIRQGASPVDVAYLLGHKNTTMVIKTYTHIIDRPKTPNIVN